MPRLVLLLLFLSLTVASAHPIVKDSTDGTPTKSPTTAVLLSLALPGAGQFYNEVYWKIPVFTGTCAVSAYFFFKNNSDFNYTSDLYDKAVADSADQNVIDRLFAQKEAYRDNRDLSGFVFLAAYAIAAVDAYVGAHLYDFDVGDDLSLGIGPSRSQLLSLNMRLRF